MEAPKEWTACRVCGETALIPVLDLGVQSLTGFLQPGEQPRWGPLQVVLCTGCTLLQMRHSYPGNWLYRWYGYRSGINPMMVAALQDVAESTTKLAQLEAGDVVVDVGSNDGTLLRQFAAITPGLKRIGFEPAQNLAAEGAQGLDRFVPDYFSPGEIAEFLTQWGKAKAVTAIAMFYDLDDPVAFCRGVREILRDDGLFVIQMNYLVPLLEQTGFDNFSHEHVAFYALRSLLPVLQRGGFAVLSAELNAVNGGSIRVTCVPWEIRHREGYQGVAEVLAPLLAQEEAVGVAKTHTYMTFAGRVRQIRRSMYSLVRQLATTGQQVYVYGASTRGLVIMHACGLTSDLIQGAAERNPDKWGRVYAGTGIVCVPEEEARDKADVFLVLPWHFLDEFMAREAAFLERGGRFLVPLPTPQLIGRRDGRRVVEDLV